MIAALTLAAFVALAVAVPAGLVLACWMFLAAINHDLARDQRSEYVIQPKLARRCPQWLSRFVGGAR